jgi:hypothetical protein
MKPVLAFGIACWCTFLIVCAITVFGLDQFERAWGPWGSFGVEAWVSTLGALVAMGAFGIASAFLRRTHQRNTALLLGVACGGVFAAVCWMLDRNAFSGGVYTALAALIAVPCLAAYMGEVVDS